MSILMKLYVECMNLVALYMNILIDVFFPPFVGDFLQNRFVNIAFTKVKILPSYDVRQVCIVKSVRICNTEVVRSVVNQCPERIHVSLAYIITSTVLILKIKQC